MFALAAVAATDWGQNQSRNEAVRPSISAGVRYQAVASDREAAQKRLEIERKRKVLALKMVQGRKLSDKDQKFISELDDGQKAKMEKEADIIKEESKKQDDLLSTLFSR